MPFYLIANLICTTPTLTNSTSMPWNNHDDEMVQTAQKRCRELFKDRSPCLKTFEKIGERDYKATCGEALKTYE